MYMYTSIPYYNIRSPPRRVLQPAQGGPGRLLAPGRRLHNNNNNKDINNDDKLL